MKHLCVAMALLMMPVSAHAVGVDADQLADPVLETKARTIMKDLRCLVCQNQSIEDSNADLARDLRALVRQRVAAGEDEAEVKAYLVQRYGDWVLLTPPVKPDTWILWAAPAFLLGIGGLVAWRSLRRLQTKIDLDEAS
jgi:cytochrome c-type biogenesis protein CcmH